MKETKAHGGILVFFMAGGLAKKISIQVSEDTSCTQSAFISYLAMYAMYAMYGVGKASYIPNLQLCSCMFVHVLHGTWRTYKYFLPDTTT